ncbi:copper resistance protein B [Permianibacter aggregans]|uniref:Copper resistance protein B n=1 Tax=Permianibacter aggregans TaxID=1510150 RepID=A0A4R6UG41_9GAMM|nr:copper resistance protein B [Permianibacter aggregans]TDQ44956.1 copper resistance protein B [Permianibacter aggregans]
MSRHLGVWAVFTLLPLSGNVFADPPKREQSDYSEHPASNAAKPKLANAHSAHRMSETQDSTAAPGESQHDHDSVSNRKTDAPVSARDPDQWSDGLKRGEGPYFVARDGKLRLMDEKWFAAVMFEEFEYQDLNAGGAGAYDAQAWYGRTYDRLTVKAEGAFSKGRVGEARSELLWSHAIASFWDAQLGARFDKGEDVDRRWLALGIQGLAPYWFEVDGGLYLGEQGRSALRLSASYDVVFTQRLILVPVMEVEAFGKADAPNGIGKGLATGTFGLRFRYEFSRQFAPYIGVEQEYAYGDTAELRRQRFEEPRETYWVAGVRFWF